MSHLALSCFMLNLTDACPETSSMEGRCCAGTSQLIYNVNHLTGYCMVRILLGGGGEEGVLEQILVVYIFINYIFVNIFFIIGSILLSQDYRRVQMVLFYLSMPVDSVLWYARVGIQISNTSI